MAQDARVGAMLRDSLGLHEAEARKRFFAWLEEDPRHILALLRRRARGYQPDLMGLRVVSSWARNLFGTYRARLREPLGHVIAALKRAPEDDLFLAALLGAAAGAAQGGGELTGIASALAADESRRGAVRALAAEVLLSCGLEGAGEQEALELALRAATQEQVLVMRRVLARIRRQGPAARGLLGALLRCQASTRDDGWTSSEILRTLIAVAPDDPRVRERLVAATNSRDHVVRRVAREAMFRRPVEEVLAYLETASAPTRAAGAAALLARGVAGERLAPHVLAALRAGDYGTRERAIQMLGKVGQDVATVLPIVEEHLASSDAGRWLTAVRTLGALATVPGDKRPVAERLLAVGRRADVRVRKAAVQAILMHDARPQPVITFLTFLLDDGDATVRAEAVDALGELSARQPDARAALERARSDPSEQVRELVGYWLDTDD